MKSAFWLVIVMVFTVELYSTNPIQQQRLYLIKDKGKTHAYSDNSGRTWNYVPQKLKLKQTSGSILVSENGGKTWYRESDILSSTILPANTTLQTVWERTYDTIAYPAFSCTQLVRSGSTSGGWVLNSNLSSRVSTGLGCHILKTDESGIPTWSYSKNPRFSSVFISEMTDGNVEVTGVRILSSVSEYLGLGTLSSVALNGTGSVTMQTVGDTAVVSNIINHGLLQRKNPNEIQQLKFTNGLDIITINNAGTVLKKEHFLDILRPGYSCGYRALKELANGDILFAGVESDVVKNEDAEFFVAHIDAQGKTLWRTNFGLGKYYLGASYINNDGSSVVMFNEAVKGGYKVHMIILQADGTIAQQYVLDDLHKHSVYGITALQDGQYLVRGCVSEFLPDKSNPLDSTADAFVAKVSNTGKVEWKHVWVEAGKDEIAAQMYPISADEFVIVRSNYPDKDGITMGRYKVSATSVTDNKQPEAEQYILPNPAQSYIDCSRLTDGVYGLYNSQGEMVLEFDTSVEKIVSTTSLANGIYYIHSVHTKGESQRFPVSIIR